MAQLTVHERNAIRRAADLMPFAAGDVLLRAHTVPEIVYFPVDCVATVVRRLSNGTSVELAMIGPEGLIGIDAFLEADAQLDDTVVVAAGSAYRIAAADLKNDLRRGDGLQRQLLRFAGVLKAQTAQTLICGRLHAPEQRLARWLLMIRDRTSPRTLPVGVQSIPAAIGIEDSKIAAAVKRLTASRLIRAGDHAISILDADGLEAMSCECYDSIRPPSSS